MKSIFTLFPSIIGIYTLINVSYGSCNLDQYEHPKSVVPISCIVPISHYYIPDNQTANYLEHNHIPSKNITKSKKSQLSRTCHLIESIDNLNKQMEIIKTKFNNIGNDNINIDNKPLSQIYKAEYLLNQLKKFKSDCVDNDKVINNRKEHQKLKKSCRQLGDALDTLQNVNRALEEKAGDLEKSFPFYNKDTYRKAANALTIFTEWQNIDIENCNPTEKTYQENFLLKNLDKNNEIKFFIFICPPTDFKALNTEKPEEYLQLSLEKSLISKQTPSLGILFNNLNKLDIKASLVAFIGDGDEEDYIWPTLGQPNLNQEKLDKRRHLLKDSTTMYLTQNIKASSVKVFSLALDFSDYALNIYDEIRDKTDKYFNIEDYKQEEKRIKSLFLNYYKGLFVPEPDKIKQIVIDKFATYAKHGVIAYIYDPELFLIQTEFPPQLRNKMLNIMRLKNFPVLHLKI